MVMSKVSKAIVASFLCLTINVGYNVTNAREFENCCNEFRNGCNSFDDIEDNKEESFSHEKKESKQFNDDQDKDKNDQDEDGKDKNGQNKNTWRLLIGLIAGLISLFGGFCLGKFVL